MGHVDGLLLFLDLMGAVDADRDGGHHVAPPCAVFSHLRCCREAAPSVAGARIFESRLDPVKRFLSAGVVLSWLLVRTIPTDPTALAHAGAAPFALLLVLLAIWLWSLVDAWREAGR